MKICLYDTETTGLLSPKVVKLEKQPQILELFALTLNQEGEGEDAVFTEVSARLWMFNPGKPISPIITRITGLRDADVADAPPFSKCAEEVKAFLEDADRVVAHNLSFDLGMVGIEMERCGKKVDWPELCCSVEQTITLRGYRLKLTDLHEFLFGEPLANAHRAENDVRGLARCYCELVKRDLI